MSRGTAPAPIYVDAFSLCEWVLGRLDGRPGVLAGALCRLSLRLLTALSLALRDRRRDAQLAAADECLLTLRVLLQLAHKRGLLTEEQLVHALDLADRVGRQLGGWRRALDAEGG